jgi:hypothetical protein
MQRRIPQTQLLIIYRFMVLPIRSIIAIFCRDAQILPHIIHRQFSNYFSYFIVNPQVGNLPSYHAHINK